MTDFVFEIIKDPDAEEFWNSLQKPCSCRAQPDCNAKIRQLLLNFCEDVHTLVEGEYHKVTSDTVFQALRKSPENDQCQNRRLVMQIAAGIWRWGDCIQSHAVDADYRYFSEGVDRTIQEGIKAVFGELFLEEDETRH